jgi:O-antigen ligase
VNQIAIATTQPSISFGRSTDRCESIVPAKACFFFLCLFTVAIYARPEDIFPMVGKFHLTLLLGLCAAVAYISTWFSGAIPIRFSKELRLMLWLTAWFVAGIPFAYWRGGSFHILTDEWFKTLLVFFLLTQTLVSVTRIRTILWAIILSELVVTAYSVFSPSGSVWIGQRLSGVSEGILGWNFLGIAAGLTLPYIVVLLISRPSFLKSMALTAAVVSMMWMLVLTASRSGLLVVALSLLLTWLLILRRIALGSFVAAGLTLAITLAVCAAPGVFWQRIQTIWTDSAPNSNVSASADASTEERQAVLVASVRYTLQHPVFGVGLGNFSVVRGTETGVASGWLGSHNTFTQLSSEAGIPALIIFLALVGTCIRNMWRIARTEVSQREFPEVNRLARATIASLLAFSFGAFFAHIAYEYFLYYPIAIAVAVQYLTSVAPISAASKPKLPSAFSMARI